MKLKVWSRSLLFNLDYYFAMLKLRSITGNLYTYPLIVYLTFSKTKIKARYVAGESMNSIILSRVDNIIAGVKRHILRKPIDFNSPLGQRFYQWSLRMQKKTEEKEYLEEMDKYKLENNIT